MMMFVLLFFNLFFSDVQAIDTNEKLGRCISGFRVPHVHQVQENEGIWFPQYRTRDARNKKYKCHTVYEKMDYGEPTSIFSESYYTLNNISLKDPYSQSYRQDVKDVLIDEEYENQGDAYKVYSYVIGMRNDYRVRYVCTDHPKSLASAPLVYIETRSSNPSFDDIKPAINEVRKAGLKLTLERIDQKNCVRPLGYDGYDTSQERHERRKND